MNRERSWHKTAPRPRRRGRTKGKSYSLLACSCQFSSGLGFVANHFDVVSVRTNDESCIVVAAVLRAQTRRTIVLATRVQSRAIESLDLVSILGRERQVKVRRLLPGLEQTQ